MKCKVECSIVPVDFWGEVKSRNYALKTILYFNNTKAAAEFLECNSDRILSDANMIIGEDNQI